MHGKILLIGGGTSIIRFLSLSLGKNGYKAIETRNGIEGVLLFISDNLGLILLDLRLLDTDDSEVLRQIRSQSEMPILVVPARGQEREKVEALGLGVDDYVTESFHINRLLTRVRVALYKKTPRIVREKVFVLDDLRVDSERYRAHVEDWEVHLTPIRFKLLVLLTEHASKVLTHSFIICSIWGYSSCRDSRLLRVFITSTRGKTEKDSSHPRYTLTGVGVGYRFVDE